VSEVNVLLRGRPRVLVVDDLADEADTLATALRLWRYDAEGCPAGTLALEIARTYRPHVALLDITMPGMSGVEVARCLREEPALVNTLIIGVGGYGDKACRARVEGFDHYLLKPVDLDRLQELIGRALSVRRMVVASARVMPLRGAVS
jgi:CheY-like chemotaxis protein